MSSSTVELVRRAVVAAGRRPQPDWKTINELFHPEHELHSPLEGLEGGYAGGAAGFRDMLVGSRQAAPRCCFRLERYGDAGGD
jgi:hypothetical protein